MAYSSEQESAGAVRGFVPPQNEEERLLMRRVGELCERAQQRAMPQYTGFLSDREQTLAQAALHRAECSCAHFDGGYPEAERKVLCIEPPDTWQEQPWGVVCFTAHPLSGERAPTHRDYLGAILGLGLRRACVGDLLPDPQMPLQCYAVVLQDKAEWIAAELTSAGRCPVTAQLCEQLPEQVRQGPPHVIQQASVSSLRADAVLAAMMHTSRGNAAEYIAAGKVEINHLPLRAAHEQLYAQDIITVRGTGRYRLVALGGKTRKDRQFITFFQYT